MLRFNPGAVLLLCTAAIVFVTCDAPPSSDLLSPEAPVQEIVDGRDILSNVYLLPPIGESYTAINFDEYTPTRVEVCSLDDPYDGVLLENYTAAMWDELEGRGCLDETSDPWFAYYQETSSTDGVTFVELKRDAAGNPEHYQVNLKTDEGMAQQTFRVTVFTLSWSPTSGVYWEPKAWFGIGLFDDASAINVPDDWVGETAGKNFPAKYVVEESQEGDSFLAKVSCDSLTLTGTTAGVHMFENTFTDCTKQDPQDTTFFLLQEKLTVDTDAGELCIPVGWEQNPDLCYHWQYYFQWNGIIEPYHGELYTPTMVIYCAPEDPNLSDPVLWHGLRSPHPYVPGGVVYETQNANAEQYFDPACDVFWAMADAPTGFYAALQGVPSGLARFLGLNPRPLYAAHGGFGELVIGTSRLGRAKGKQLIYESGDGQSGLVGSQLSQPLVAQVVSVPHDDGHAPVGQAGETVTFEITSSTGGYLSLTPGGLPANSLDVVSDPDGYARVWWTLGTEAGTETVDAYGEGFGILVDDPNAEPGDTNSKRFEASLVTYTATAIDVVTDFREPLDEKSDFSGVAYGQALPHVLLCEVPEGGTGADVAQPCPNPMPEFDDTEIKLTEDNGRWFYQVNWKPKEYGIDSGHTFVVQVVLDGGIVVGQSVEIVVDKGGKVELVAGQLQINPTTDVPIKFTLSRITP